MSGMVMIRRADGIDLFSDGGVFRGADNFTITGFVSKPIVLPHLSAVMCFCGTSEMSLILRGDQQPRWETFDHLVFMIRDGLRAVSMKIVNGYFNDRDKVNGVLFIGGYSERRERWESYMVTVKAKRGEDPEIGPLVDDFWFLFTPEASEDAMRRYGFDPKSFDPAPVDAAVRFMRAMRATAQDMEGPDDAEPRKASTIAGFIERVTVTRDFALSQVVWRWPDVTGYTIDPDDEGEPTSAFRALLEAADAAREDGGVHEHVDIPADAANDSTFGETGQHVNDTGSNTDPAAADGFHGRHASAALDVVLAENDLATVDDASGLVPATVPGEATAGEAEQLRDEAEEAPEETASRTR